LIGPTDGFFEGKRFNVNLSTASPEVWSACVDETGVVPKITVTTIVGISGTPLQDGVTTSRGVVGGSREDLDKALTIQFKPVWRECAEPTGAE